MASGSFYFKDENGYPQHIDNPREWDDYNVIIGTSDLNNATDATVTLYTGRNGSGGSESIYPGGSRYSTAVYLSCRFTR
ncbi:hypothetical protein [Nocardia brevicatena]|uniref:hypothetical protein n=1 Tax=Nocardia brevicatena TaxID=37327 RepID=UPI0002D9FAD9|nr:hypothetical protein [Nocardia brevicatena]